MADAIDKAVRAQGGGVVKPHQVVAMILAARRAYKVQSELGLVDDGVDFDAWRKATLHDVTGGDAPESFRTVTQRDYAAVLAYFGELAGERAEARRSDTIKVADERARALWALDLAEEEVAEPSLNLIWVAVAVIKDRALQVLVALVACLIIFSEEVEDLVAFKVVNQAENKKHKMA